MRFRLCDRRTRLSGNHQRTGQRDLRGTKQYCEKACETCRRRPRPHTKHAGRHRALQDDRACTSAGPDEIVVVGSYPVGTKAAKHLQPDRNLLREMPGLSKPANILWFNSGGNNNKYLWRRGCNRRCWCWSIGWHCMRSTVHSPRSGSRNMRRHLCSGGGWISRYGSHRCMHSNEQRNLYPAH